MVRSKAVEQLASLLEAIRVSNPELFAHIDLTIQHCAAITAQRELAAGLLEDFAESSE